MNSSTRPATASFADLWNTVSASGLLSAEQLAKLSSLAEGDTDKLSLLLAEQGLTGFQIAAMKEGRGTSLRVSNYDILDRLGAGGMGTVFKARHRRMKRVVALKVLAANLSNDPIYIKRFQREVEAIASLGHPNIVMAYDADEAESGHFLVMEFVQGRDLAVCVERDGPLGLKRATDYILQTARGLAYAHSQGIVHRDIKPQNLLLDDIGTVKITDLGLARLNHGDDGPAVGTDVTMVGGALGTPDYMPPEQAIDATAIDHRADIYSLGCTLHFLLTGKSPFTGTTLMAILLAHRDAAIPSLTAAIPQTPARLDHLFQRMLAKVVTQRVQTMAEVVTELEAIVADLPPDALPTGRSVPASRGPVRAAQSTADISGRTVVVSPAENHAFDSQTRVLVVEPSRVQASIIRNFLQEQSLAVVGTAHSGTAAIEEVRQHRPQAVVSSLYLPDMSGLELAQQIRAAVATNAPGFILITSESAEADAALLGNLHRVQLLFKPFSSEQLSAAVSQVTGASTGMIAPQGISAAKLSRERARVMIVDDSGTARINARNVLKELGFSQFLEVADGAQAVAVAAREHFDLIVTDYNMPLMDGRALVSYLRQTPATANVPIIMVTTETDPVKLDPVRNMGVLAIVEKAFPASTVGPLLAPLF